MLEVIVVVEGNFECEVNLGKHSPSEIPSLLKLIEKFGIEIVVESEGEPNSKDCSTVIERFNEIKSAYINHIGQFEIAIDIYKS